MTTDTALGHLEELSTEKDSEWICIFLSINTNTNTHTHTHTHRVLPPDTDQFIYAYLLVECACTHKHTHSKPVFIPSFQFIYLWSHFFSICPVLFDQSLIFLYLIILLLQTLDNIILNNEWHSFWLTPLNQRIKLYSNKLLMY